ncbi:MAG: hypothetical protein AAGC96_08470 [Pseudomonadota bacterium]
MYSESLSLYRRLYVWVGLIVFVQLLAVFTNSDPEVSLAASLVTIVAGFGSFLVWIMLSYYAFADLLSSQMTPDVYSTRRIISFALRTIFLLLLTMLLSGLVAGGAVWIATGLLSLDVSFAPGSSFMSVFTVLVVPVMSLAMIVIYSLLGTCLPASVVGQKHGFAGHFQLGKSQFWQTAVMLFIGPTVLSILSQGLNLLYSRVSTVSYFPTPELWSAYTSTGHFNLPAILVQIVNGLIGALVIVMSAWILTSAYRNAVGRTSIAEVFE